MIMVLVQIEFNVVQHGNKNVEFSFNTYIDTDFVNESLSLSLSLCAECWCWTRDRLQSLILLQTSYHREESSMAWLKMQEFHSRTTFLS